MWQNICNISLKREGKSPQDTYHSLGSFGLTESRAFIRLTASDTLPNNLPKNKTQVFVIAKDSTKCMAILFHVEMHTYSNILSYPTIQDL